MKIFAKESEAVHPLLISIAFRPLFLLMALQAVAGIGLWSAWWSGLLVIEWPPPRHWGCLP